jgi:hypothetical protein
MHEVAPKSQWRGLSPKGILVPFRRKMPGLHAVTAGPLQNGENDRRVWPFGQRPSVLGNTDHFDAVSVRHPVIAAKCNFYRAEDFAHKLLIHYRNPERVLETYEPVRHCLLYNCCTSDFFVQLLHGIPRFRARGLHTDGTHF